MKRSVAITLFLSAPAWLVFTHATHGEYLPYISTLPSQQWNIQYLPFVVLSLSASVLAITARLKIWPANVLLFAAAWNFALLVIGLYVMASLWGEKY